MLVVECLRYRGVSRKGPAHCLIDGLGIIAWALLRRDVARAAARSDGAVGRWVIWLVFAFMLVEGWRKYRATQTIWAALAADRFGGRSMPLAPAIEAFARERAAVRSAAARSGWPEMLNAGVPLPDALDQCPGLLPRYAVPTVRVGYEAGTLAHAPAPGRHGPRPRRADSGCRCKANSPICF